MDFGDPNSVDNAVQGAIRAGALDQATALQNLNFTRTIRAALPETLASLNTALGGATQPASAPAPSTSAAPAAPDQIAHMKGTYDFAQDAANKMLALPLGDRVAAFQQIKQEGLARGLPEAAIDQFGQNVEDDDKLKSLSDYYGQLSAHAGQALTPPTDGSAPIAAPPPHPAMGGGSWYMNLLQHPELIAKLDALKAAGYDMTPLISQATTLAAPEIAQEAAVRNAPGLAAGTEAGKAPYDVINTFVNGVPTQMPRSTFLAAQAAGFPGLGVDLTPGQKAQQTAGGTGAGSAPYEIVTLHKPDGSIVEGPKSDFLAHTGNFAPGGGGGAAGQGITPSEQAYKTEQAGQAAKLLAPNPDAFNGAKDTEANALRALSIIGSIKFDNATDFKSKAANLLRTAGFGGADIDKYANDLAGYRQLTTQALTSGAHNIFPQRVTNSDLKLMHDVYPTITTPNDAAAVATGTQAAQAHRVQEWENFKADYTGPHDSPQAIQQAWANGPGGRSVLQSPVWQNIKIAGRPAFNPATDVKVIKGQKIGAWGLGTGHPVYFVVQ